MATCFRLGVISDTHGVSCDEVVAAFTRARVQAIIHAGDVGHHGGHTEVLQRLRRAAPVYAVRGNVDPGPVRTTRPSEGQEPEPYLRIDTCRWLPQVIGRPEGPTGEKARRTGSGQRWEMGAPARGSTPEPCAENDLGMAVSASQHVKRRRLGEDGGKEALGATGDSEVERQCRHQAEEQQHAQKEQQHEKEVVAEEAEEEEADLLPDHLLLEVAGWHILVTHIVGKPPAVDPAAASLIAQHQPHIVVFGHSHAHLQVHHEGVLYLNPGSAGPARFKLPRTAALLDLPCRHTDTPLHAAGVGPGVAQQQACLEGDSARSGSSCSSIGGQRMEQSGLGGSIACKDGDKGPVVTLVPLAQRAPPRLTAGVRGSGGGRQVGRKL